MLNNELSNKGQVYLQKQKVAPRNGMISERSLANSGSQNSLHVDLNNYRSINNMPMPASVSNRKYHGQIYRNAANEVNLTSIRKNSVSPQGLRNLNSDNLNAELKNIAA
jgi:predicted DNA-binding ribbon-helix-helix protein